MASHSRHVVSGSEAIRRQIKFDRSDLLWVCDRPLIHPQAREVLAHARAHGIDPPPVTEVARLPIRTSDGYLVGPTILDMLVRKVRVVRSLPVAAGAAIRQAARAAGGDPPRAVVTWSLRDTDELWPGVGQRQLKTPVLDDDDDERKQLHHPFLAGLASGGMPIPGGRVPGWVRVSKQSTVSISDYAYRLACGMVGSVSDGYREVCQIAQAAWDRDQARVLAIAEGIAAAPGRVLVEDAALAATRPISSISQEVEAEMMKRACNWLGVDLAANVSRGRGRPRAAAGDEGEVIRVRLVDGTTVGVFKKAFGGVAEGTALEFLDVMRLAEVLGELRTDGLGADADLLEAYLEARDPDWREAAAAAAAGEPSASAESPYDVLGVLPTATTDEIAAAFRTVMHAVQHLPNTAPQRRLIAAFKTIKEARKTA